MNILSNYLQKTRDYEECCYEFKQWQTKQIRKRDELIEIYENYINWLKIKPSKIDLAHAVYERQIETLKKEIQ